MDERTNALPLGTELEGYRVAALLGAGGFGITYKAIDLLLDRPVAIKEYLPSVLASRNTDHRTVRPFGRQEAEQFAWGLERFRSEAKTLVAFQHPNIVPVHRYFEANGTGYLVMAFQDGKSLADVIDAVGTLSEEELLTILRPLAAGLADIHAKGFLHRDIKPANIIIRRDGTPVLIDFGAARQAVTRHSRGLTAIVTEGYAPYEQYETDSYQGPWTDLYALGAVLYHCVTGDRPPEAPKRIATQLRKQPDAMVPAVNAAAGRYSENLLAAIDRALAVEEAKRPQSVSEFMALIEGRGAPSPVVEENAAAAALQMLDPPSQPPSAPPPADTGLASDAPLAAGNVMIEPPSVPLDRLSKAAPAPRSQLPLGAKDAVGEAESATPASSATIIIGASPPPRSREPSVSAVTPTLPPEPPRMLTSPRTRRFLAAVMSGIAAVAISGVAIGYFVQRGPPPKAPLARAPAPAPSKIAAPVPSPAPPSEGAQKSRASAPESLWEHLAAKQGQDVVRRIFVLPGDQLLVAGGRVDGEGRDSDAWFSRFDGKEGKPVGERKTISNTRLETGNAVVRLADGAVVVAGARRNPGTNAFVAWVARVSPEAETQWQHTFGERSLTVPYAVLALPNGDIIVVGTAVEDSKRGNQGWAARIAADGKTVLWNRVFGRGGDDSLQSVAALADGGVIAVGWTSIERPTGEDRNLWVVNLDAQGNLRWEKKDFGDEADEKGKAVLVTEDGELMILAESSRAPATIVPPNRLQPAADTGPVTKPWLLRLAADGSVRWQRRYGGALDEKSDSLDAIVPAGDRGFFLAGWTESHGAGRKDGWLLRIDGEGTTLWEKSLGQQFDDEFTAIVALADGGIVLGGSTATKLDAPPQPPRPARAPPYAQPVQGEAKLWLLRLGYK
jgi:serine/threonine protein kinase